MPANPCYKIERCSEGYVISLCGRGTLQESPAFRDFASQCLDHRRKVVVDLSDCVYLDSTFLGCLIGLHKRGLQLGKGMFRIFADQACRLRLLSTSGLHQFLDYVDQRPDTNGDCMSLEFGQFDAHALGRHVMNSHRLLADLGGEDADKFKSIADRLQRELDVPPSTN